MNAQNTITLICSIIALATSIISAIIVAKFNHFNEISKERINWLDRFREEIGDISKGILLVKNKGKIYFTNEKDKEIILNAESARCRLISRLKTEGENNLHNIPLKKELEKINFGGDLKNIKISYILKCANRVLEKEWGAAKKGR